ncbi:MAG: hypothetical protein HC907_22085 [Richelia sp. SM1_7_0]|nr:hypothetical protein [Richelia sp. SM1_7_0]
MGDNQEKDIYFNELNDFLEGLKLRATEHEKEKYAFLQLKLEDIYQQARTNQISNIRYAEYLADIAKGIIPTPKLVEHNYPGYDSFWTDLDGNYNSGDITAFKDWKLKKINVEKIMKRRENNERITKAALRISASLFVIYVILFGFHKVFAELNYNVCRLSGNVTPRTVNALREFTPCKR